MSGIQKLASSFLLCVLALAVLGPLVTPFDPGDFSAARLQPPNSQHWLGTDGMGQDIFSGLLTGFRVTVGVSLVAAVLSISLGLFFALLTVCASDWLRRGVSFFIDVLLLLPEMMVVMLFASFAGPSVTNIILVMCFFSWARVARILQKRISLLLQQDSLQYTLLMKGGLLDILRKLVPPLVPALATIFIQQAGRAAVYESTLAYLGLGDPTLHSWGRMIKAALDYEGIFWNQAYTWWLVPPILCLIVYIVLLALVTFRFGAQKSDFSHKQKANITR